MIKIKGLETYFGGKGASGTYQKIINHIPEHDCFISGFLGADFIIRNMNNLPKYIIGIDADPYIISLWSNAVEMLEDKGKNLVLKNERFLDAIQELYYEIKIHPHIFNFKNPFIYLDPPYPVKTRSSKHKYKFDMSDIEHVELLREVRQIKLNIAISTYDNDLYRAMLHDWNKIQFWSTTQKGRKLETLYMNYDINKLRLQDISYAGETYRERDRIRQKCKRWKNRIKSMEKAERDYLFTELKKFYQTLDVISGDNFKNSVIGPEHQK